MSVLVYAENAGGKFKKSTYEVLSFGYAIAEKTGGSLTVLSIGDVNADELAKLSKYGASKVLNVTNEKLKSFVNMAYAAVIAEAAKSEDSKVVIMSASFTGKGLAPRVAVKLEAGLVDGAISLPETTNGFTVRKGAFSGKAFADVTLTSDIKVITLMPNSYQVNEHQKESNIVDFNPIVRELDFMMGAPARSKAIKKREAEARSQQMAAASPGAVPAGPSVEPDAGSHAPGGAEAVSGDAGIAPVRKEP